MPPPPPLRPLDIFPLQTDDGIRIHVRDHERIQEHLVVLPPFTFAVAALLDGVREVDEIRQALLNQFNAAPTREQIERIVQDLDAHYLLQSSRFEERRARLEREYLERATRPQTIFTTERRADLAGLLDAFFTADGGPGSAPSGTGRPVRGLVVPHIDYFRGGTAYAHAYKALAEGSDADLFVVLGVAHASPPAPYVLGTCGYETPFGELPADSDLIERLRKRVPWDPFRHRFAERTEHSIELQAIYLKHVIRRPIAMVPILCCSFEPWADGSPADVAQIEEFVGALRETLAGEPRKVCVLAGADLAHVGPRFGDREAVSQEMISWIEGEDRASLELVSAGDAEGFYAGVMKDGNKRKVCGLSAIYTFLRLIEGPGTLLKYGHAPDPAGGVVSFASLAF